MAKGKELMDGQGHEQDGGKQGKGRGAKARRLYAAAALAAVGVVALALTGAVEFSAAYLMARDRVDNAFVLGTVAPSVVEETFDPAGGVKENVSVRNSGNAPAYIRALVLVSWQDDSGATLSAQPAEGTDYVLTGPGSGWTLGGDGYYYCTSPVQPDASTPILIQSLTTDMTAHAGRHLCVDVIAQAVQAGPAQAVYDMWGATVDPATQRLTPREGAAG